MQAEEVLAELATAVLKLATGASATDEERYKVILEHIILTLR